ncbi:hypothetical protein [Spirosoma daeguense]
MPMSLFGNTATFTSNFADSENLSKFILGSWLAFSDTLPEPGIPSNDTEVVESEADYDFIHLFNFDVLLSSVQFLTTDNILFRQEPFLVYIPEISAPPPQPIA